MNNLQRQWRKLEWATKGKNYFKLILEMTGSQYTKRQAQTEHSQEALPLIGKAEVLGLLRRKITKPVKTEKLHKSWGKLSKLATATAGIYKTSQDTKDCCTLLMLWT